MARKRAVSVLGMIGTHSEPITSSVVVRCGLMEMHFTPAFLMASQLGYMSWSATVYSMRLFLLGSQPTNTITSVCLATSSQQVWAE